jgi:O-antigen/teichoic acid export membrane protein
MNAPAGKTRAAGETQKVCGSHSVGHRTVASNVVSTLMTNVVRRASMFLIYIMVARYLGTGPFGQLALASTLLFAWQQVALVGLQTFVAREIARDRKLTGRYLIHASIIGLTASLLGLALLMPFLLLMNYGRETNEVICLLFVGLAPMVLSQICEGVFQGLERMDLAALVNVPIGILKVITVFVVVKDGIGISGVAISLTACQVVAMLAQWFVLARWVALHWSPFRISTASQIIQASSAFLGIQATIAVKASIAVTVLSKIGGDTSVGILVAATQLLAPFSLLFNSVAFALFPALCRGYKNREEQVLVLIQPAIEGLMLIALPAVVGVFLKSNAILMLIYEDADFMLSSAVLRIVVWTLLAEALTSVIGQVLWASSRERLALRIAAATTLFHLLICLVLIRYFGSMGAAAGLLCTSLLNMGLHLALVARILPIKGLLSAVKIPLISTVAMTAFVVFGPALNLAATVLFAAIVYGMVALSLLVLSVGGIGRFKEKLAKSWSV